MSNVKIQVQKVLSIKILLLLLTIIFLNYNLFSQWERMVSPEGRINTTELFEYNSEIHTAFTGCGIYTYSTNRGKWDMKKSSWYSGASLKNNSLFVSKYEGNSYKGVYLIDLNLGYDSEIFISSKYFTVLAHSDSCLYGTSGSEVMKMDFDGSNVQNFHNGLPVEIIHGPGGSHDIWPVNSIELVDSFIVCGTNSGVYISKSNELEWHSINNGIDIGEVSIIKEYGNILFCAIDSILYASNNLGGNWNELAEMESDISSIYYDGAKIFVTTKRHGIFKSDNMGTQWLPINEGLTELSIKNIKEINNKIYCTTLNKGIFLFENNLWSNFNAGISCENFSSILLKNGEFYGNTYSGIKRTEENVDWVDITPDIEYRGFTSLRNKGDSLLINVHPPFNDSITGYSIWSIDGSNWKLFNSPVIYNIFDPAIKIIVEGEKIFHLDRYNNLYISTDFGLNWDQYEPPFNVDLYASYNGKFYCSNRSGELISLENDGSWKNEKFNLPDRFFEKIMFVNDFILIQNWWGEIFRRKINEDYWENLNFDLNLIVNSYVEVDSILFISTSAGVFYSSNIGDSWTQFNEGLINLATKQLLVKLDSLYVNTTNSGIWKRVIDKDNLTSINDKSNEFDISIFPNPASNYISISSKYFSDIQVKIFSLEGREMFSGVGFNNLKIDTAKYSKGIYLVNVVINQMVITKKIILH